LSSSPYFVDVALISFLGSVLANPKPHAAPLRGEPTVSAGGIGVLQFQGSLESGDCSGLRRVKEQASGRKSAISC